MKFHTCITLTAVLLAFAARAQNGPPPLPGDQHWDPQFGPVGVSDQVYCIGANSTDVYVGGLFTMAGNVNANFIADFNGDTWTNLGRGLGTYSLAIAVDHNNVYVGGNFGNADNSAHTGGFAKWDGTNWSSVGGGVPGVVTAINIQGTNIYVGGIFGMTNTVGPPATNFARWNGQYWSAVGGPITGAGGEVSCIAVNGSDIYIGGSFTTAGGVPCANVAHWNGASWSALGGGIPANAGIGVTIPIMTIAAYGNNIYVGGGFTNAGQATNLAVWDGSSWSGVGADLRVRDLATDGATLYAVGDFRTIAGVSASRVAAFDGSNWTPLGTGLAGFGASASLGAWKIALRAPNQLFIGGNFNQVGGVGASHVAWWDGAAWHGLGGAHSKGLTHFNGNVRGLTTLGTNVYAGGIFTEAGDLIANCVAQWNGTAWTNLGAGLTGTLVTGASPNVFALTSVGADLYAGGNFNNADGVAVQDIAMWDGANWNDVGGGMNSNILAFATDGSSLYVGGTFTTAGGTGVSRLAAWNGSFWSDVGGGATSNVNALAWQNGVLYVGGNFTAVNSGSTAASHLAAWDGANWSTFGDGLNNNVNAIAFVGNTLYVGGNFTTAGGATAKGIAQWNGASWSALGSGLSLGASTVVVSALLTSGTNLYVGGSFTNAGGIVANRIAKWDGATWTALGSGFTNLVGSATVNSLAMLNNDLYVGGLLSWAGAKPSMFIAHWNDQINYYPPPALFLKNFARLTNGQSQFRITGTSGESYIIQASTNLPTWTSILTNTLPLYDYSDTNSTNLPRRFYQAIHGP